MTSFHVSTSSRWVYAFIWRHGKLITGTTDSKRLTLPSGKLTDTDYGNPDVALQRVCREKLGLDVTLRQLAQPKVGCIGIKEFETVRPPAMPPKVILQFFYVLEASDDWEPRAPYDPNFRSPWFVSPASLKGRQKRYDLMHTLENTMEYFHNRGLMPPPEGLDTFQTDFPAISNELERLQFHPSNCQQMTRLKPLGEYKPMRVIPESSPQAAL